MLTIDAQSDNRPVPAGQVEQHSILVQQAFTAIDAAASVEEVKKVLDQWAGLAAYARAAKEKQLEADATEIKMRAERRLGEMMQAQKETVGFHKGGGDHRSDHRGFKNPGDPPTLAEAGIDKNLAKSARKEAAKSKEQFEEDVAEKKSGILEGKSKPKPINPKPLPDIIDGCIARMRRHIEDTILELNRYGTQKRRTQLERLFAGLADTIDDLERKAKRIAHGDDATLHRDPFKEDWRKRPLSELEHRIEIIRMLAGKGHHFDDAQWKQVDRMRKRAADLSNGGNHVHP